MKDSVRLERRKPVLKRSSVLVGVAGARQGTAVLMRFSTSLPIEATSLCQCLTEETQAIDTRQEKNRW